ncbi:hypothetical protein ABER23_27220 [Paenibacillus lautus]|uniref:hypothetical protein n=1 Tax=Paenibacillus lautus TaxID=1401 RepID=UPI003D281223
MKDVETSVSKKYVLLLLMLSLIVDSTLLLVSLKQYYLIFDTSGWNSFIVFNIVVLTLMLLISKKKIIWLPIVILFFLLIGYRIAFLFMEWEYDYVDSPKGTETLIIKHRVATLGESHYSYEFYQKSFPFLMKKLPEEDVGITVYDHDSHPNAERTLGFDRPVWLNEKEVIFESKDGRKKITLNK